jgi:NADH-quinone oxidoreductase subunit J
MILWICLALFMTFLMMIVLFRDLLYSAVALALASVMLAVVLFLFKANIAAVFELSVCAGLITVLFVSTISLTKNSDQKGESRVPAAFLPFVLVLLLALDLGLTVWLAREMLPASQDGTLTSFKEVFWTTRATDIWGQVSLVLVGVFGILAIFRVSPGRKDHE